MNIKKTASSKQVGVNQCTQKSLCFSSVFFVVVVHRHLGEKQSSPRKQKKQAITDNTITVSLLGVVF